MILHQCVVDDWLARIGDPTPLGWLTAAAYLLTAVLSYFALQTAQLNDGAEYRRFWTLMVVGFAFLGINKELDVQTLFTAAMKCVAQANGWYAERRQYQELFIVGVVVGGSFVLLSALLYFWRTIRLVAPAFLGLTLVATFITLRAASFHHADVLIGVALLEASRADMLLELPGIVLVALNATLLILLRDGGR